MTRRSIALVNLLKAYKKLEKIYLPARKGTFPPTDVEFELARAFITLFHAEVEHYFELTCNSILDSTADNFRAGVITLPALGLITFGKQDERNAGEAIIFTTKKTLRKVTERFEAAVSTHEKSIQNNHGISQGYLACLFTPLGLTSNIIDTAWVSEIQNLADKRGDFAHKSRSSTEGAPNLDPKDAIRYARKIIHGVGGSAPGTQISSLIDFDCWSQKVCSNNKIPPATKSYWSLKHRFGWWLIRRMGNSQRFP